jgi:hypothetical protein
MRHLVTFLGALSICWATSASAQIICTQNLMAADGLKTTISLNSVSDGKYTLTNAWESNVMGEIKKGSNDIEKLSCKIEMKVLGDNKTVALKKLVCGQNEYDSNRQAKEFAVLEQVNSPLYRVTEVLVTGPQPSGDGTEIGIQPDRKYKSLGNQFECVVN